MLRFMSEEHIAVLEYVSEMFSEQIVIQSDQPMTWEMAL